MKLRLGPIKNPVRIVTKVGGFRFKAADGSESFVERPAELTRPARKMYGLSAKRWFIGLMLTEEPK